MKEIIENFEFPLKVCHFFGFFPFKLLSNGQIVVFKRMIAYIVTLFFLLDIFSYFFYIHGDDFHSLDSFLTKISSFIMIFFTELFVVSTILQNFVFLRKLEKFIMVLEFIDLEVSEVVNHKLLKFFSGLIFWLFAQRSYKHFARYE